MKLQHGEIENTHSIHVDDDTNKIFWVWIFTVFGCYSDACTKDTTYFFFGLLYNVM